MRIWDFWRAWRFGDLKSLMSCWLGILKILIWGFWKFDDFADLLFWRSGYLRILRIWWFKDLKIWIANFEGVCELRIWWFCLEELVFCGFWGFGDFADLKNLRIWLFDNFSNVKISGFEDLRIWRFCVLGYLKIWFADLRILKVWGF